MLFYRQSIAVEVLFIFERLGNLRDEHVQNFLVLLAIGDTTSLKVMSCDVHLVFILGGGQSLVTETQGVSTTVQ